jgi:hypothetical protein
VRRWSRPRQLRQADGSRGRGEGNLDIVEQEGLAPERHEQVGLLGGVCQPSLYVPLEPGSSSIVKRDQAALAEFRTPDDETVGRHVIQSQMDGF